MRKRGFTVTVRVIVALTLAFFCLCLSAQASQVDPNASGSGTVHVTLRNGADQTVVRGARFTLYRVASVRIQNDQPRFAYTADFSACGVSLQNVFTEEAARAFAAYANAQRLTGRAQSADRDGTVTFSSVDKGLYLIQEEDAVPGYETAEPFLVCVPMKEDGETGWQYEINAAPKAKGAMPTDAGKTLTVQKVWDTGEQSPPESVEVSLLRDGQVTQTVRLDAHNGWTYTWRRLASAAVWDVREESVPAGYAAHYSRADGRVTITNVRTGSSTLVQTGQLLWPILLLAVGGMALAWLGWRLVSGKRGGSRD